jgi:hypothetical protein
LPATYLNRLFCRGGRSRSSRGHCVQSNELRGERECRIEILAAPGCAHLGENEKVNTGDARLLRNYFRPRERFIGSCQPVSYFPEREREPVGGDDFLRFHLETHEVELRRSIARA